MVLIASASLESGQVSLVSVFISTTLNFAEATCVCRPSVVSLWSLLDRTLGIENKDSHSMNTLLSHSFRQNFINNTLEKLVGLNGRSSTIALLVGVLLPRSQHAISLSWASAEAEATPGV